MSFWNPEKSYPTDALYTVTVKATEQQRARWETAAKRWNKGSRGAYVAFAADLATLFLDAWVKNCEDWDRMMSNVRKP